MSAKLHLVELDAREREELEGMIRGGSLPARKMKRAMALLKADEGETDQQIADAVMVGVATAVRLRRRFAREGLEAVRKALMKRGSSPGR